MVPNFQVFLLPVLESCSEQAVSLKDVLEDIAAKLDLTAEDQQELLPSGRHTRVFDRASWAKKYLKQAGLVSFPARGQFIITEEGKKVLELNLDFINEKFLMDYESFREFKQRSAQPKENDNQQSSDLSISTNGIETPDEKILSAYKEIEETLATELLDRVRQSSPKFFEELIIDLLLAMNYGGSEDNAGRALGQSGDDGVDGVIDQDPLGLDQVYIQAKRYGEDNNIGSKDIRNFIGALSIKGASKGIFITSSSFTSSAISSVQRTQTHKIITIDGLQLVRLMIKHSVGCRESMVLTLKKIDEDFFESE